jgi:hypothetical protein
MTNPYKPLPEESAVDGTSMTSSDNDLKLHRTAIAEKVTELEVARISLKEFNFLNEAMRSAFTRITKQTAYEVPYEDESIATTTCTSFGSTKSSRSCRHGHSTQTRQPRFPGTLFFAFNATGIIGPGHYAMA